MGKYGLPYVAKLCFDKAQYAAKEINKLPLFTLKYGTQFLKEFVVETENDVRSLTKYCALHGFFIHNINNSLKNCFKIAVTEKRTKQEIDNLIQCLKSYK